MRLSAKKSGFTLIEVLIAIALSALLLIVFSAVISRTYRTYSYQNTDSQFELAGRATLSRLNRQIQIAISVVNSQNVYTSGSNSLVIQLAAVDVNQVIIPVTYDYVVYRLDPADSQRLQEIVIADTSSSRPNRTRVINRHVSGFTINYFDSAGGTLSGDYSPTKRLTIELENDKTVYGRSVNQQYREQVTLRNK